MARRASASLGFGTSLAVDLDPASITAAAKATFYLKVYVALFRGMENLQQALDSELFR